MIDTSALFSLLQVRFLAVNVLLYGVFYMYDSARCSLNKVVFASDVLFAFHFLFCVIILALPT